MSQLELGRRGVQRQVVEVYEKAGCVVAPVAQSYRRGSRRNPGTPGMPDLYVFPPLRGATAFRGAATQPFWHESKRAGGKQRPGQLEWQQLCEARGVRYVLGGVPEAIAQLRSLGLVS